MMRGQVRDHASIVERMVIPRARSRWNSSAASV
jgi:hypothetical protein